jgi:UDP-N-acetylmuramoylalanine--D-glutamate ligase
VFGNHYKEFKKNVRNKISINHLKYLKDILKEIFSDLKNEKLKKNIILI